MPLEISRDIVIEEADKGSGVVVWGLEEYLKEASCQLGDSVYEEVKDNPIEKVVSRYSGCLENY